MICAKFESFKVFEAGVPRGNDAVRTVPLACAPLSPAGVGLTRSWEWGRGQ